MRLRHLLWSQVKIQCGLIEISNKSSSRIEVLLTMNSIAFFRDHHGFELKPGAFSVSVPKGEFYRRLEYFNGNKDI